jgi:hypothetical protein
MKKVLFLFVSIILSLNVFSQTITFSKYYVKSESGGQPVLVDELVRTIEIKDDVVTVTNLFGCEYTSEYRIVDKLADNKFVIAYEGQEVVLVYSEKDQVLVVTTGLGVKGERMMHMYAAY